MKKRFKELDTIEKYDYIMIRVIAFVLFYGLCIFWK